MEAEYSKGLIAALGAKGVQDSAMMNETDIVYDGRDFLAGKWYKQVYQRLTYKGGNIINEIGKRTRIILDKQCDILNNVDLVLDNPDNKSINDLIESIEVEIGGHRVDILRCCDMDTLINTSCAFFGRKVTHLNGRTYIPMVMAPFHYFNIISPSVKYHEIYILFVFKQKVSYELYGNCIVLNQEDRVKFFENELKFMCVQHQIIYDEPFVGGKNKYYLGFNHPVPLIFFWGFDKSKVTNIKLTLDENVFYDGPLEPLEHFKLSKGFDIEPVVIWFSHAKFHKPDFASLNFSRIDKAILEIDTTDDTKRDINIVGYNYQPGTYRNGMYGLRYTK